MQNRIDLGKGVQLLRVKAKKIEFAGRSRNRLGFEEGNYYCWAKSNYPAEEEKELKQTLQDLLGKGKTVKLEQKVDPSILGGLVVEFGQKVLDMSIKTRDKQMENFLREPLHF